MENKIITFLDLDGVLANFVDGALKELGITENYTVGPGYNIEEWEGVNLTTRQFWSVVDKTNEKFWLDLEPYPWTFELFDLCKEYSDEVYFLTSPARNPYCSAGKMQWIIKHFPKMRRNTILTPQKHLLAGPNRFLIDDSEHKVDPFTDHGGTGILFPQPWNRLASCGQSKVEYIDHCFQLLLTDSEA